MDKPSITVTVNKPLTVQAANTAPKIETSESVSDNQQSAEPRTKIDIQNKIMDDVPQSKAALLHLYQVTPLPINNTVSGQALEAVNGQRLALYQRQLRRNELFYTAPPHIRPTYLVQELKKQFLEFDQYHMVQALDEQAVIDLDKVQLMWQQLHIVDDLINDIVRRMPAQKPVGWQLVSGSKNHLKLPTVGRLRDTESIADQGSINSYVLGHFGVMSYTFDRAFFIGHIIGYLFCCYYFAHLSITYGVTPLPQKSVPDYQFASLDTAKVVRLLQSIDEQSKRRVYQLAVYCARISGYKLDKYVEKLLITQVNDFDKKQQVEDLDMLLVHGIMPANQVSRSRKNSDDNKGG